MLCERPEARQSSTDDLLAERLPGRPRGEHEPCTGGLATVQIGAHPFQDELRQGGRLLPGPGARSGLAQRERQTELGVVVQVLTCSF